MIVARAPLRLPFAGGGTDLPSYYGRFGSSFVSAALDLSVYVAVGRPVGLAGVRGRWPQGSEHVPRAAALADDLTRAGLAWAGVASRVEVTSFADAPGGSGLGSSSSYAVALVVALARLTGRAMDPRSVAETAYAVETGDGARLAGKQDHYVASFGGVRSYEIDRDGEVSVGEPLAVHPTIDDSLMLAWTGATRRADDRLAVQVDGLSAGDDQVVGALHRARSLVAPVTRALVEGDVAGCGALLDRHWTMKKRRDSGVSSPAVDRAYEAAVAAGALGGKLVGAGGGGFLLLCVAPGSRPDVERTLVDHGLSPQRFASGAAAAGIVTGMPCGA